MRILPASTIRIGSMSVAGGSASAPPAIPSTWNPVDKSTFITLSGGNLTATWTTDLLNDHNMRGIGGKTSGKWYFETVFSALDPVYYTEVGVANISATLDGAGKYLGFDNNSWAAFSVLGGGGIYHNNANSGSVSFAGYTTTDVVMVALDLDNGKLWIGKNGTWPSSGNPAAGTGFAWNGIAGTIYPAVGGRCNTVSNVGTSNFGATAFAYAAPTGFTGWTQ